MEETLLAMPSTDFSESIKYSISFKNLNTIKGLLLSGLLHGLQVRSYKATESSTCLEKFIQFNIMSI